MGLQVSIRLLISPGVFDLRASLSFVALHLLRRLGRTVESWILGRGLDDDQSRAGGRIHRSLPTGLALEVGRRMEEDRRGDGFRAGAVAFEHDQQLRLVPDRVDGQDVRPVCGFPAAWARCRCCAGGLSGAHQEAGLLFRDDGEECRAEGAGRYWVHYAAFQDAAATWVSVFAHLLLKLFAFDLILNSFTSSSAFEV